MRVSKLSEVFRAAVFVLLVGVAFPRIARSEVRLPKVFGSHMVLQQEKPVIIWGWADPGAEVSVRLATESRQVKANEKGEWKVEFPAMKAGDVALKLSVSGPNTIALDDILVGEVWLCSGQSNMEMGVGAALNGKQEIAAANHPGIRLLKVEKRWTAEPQADMTGSWQVCTPASIAAGGWAGFSAAGYYFGRELHAKLGVPVGLIDATWGGTRIESWTPPEGFAAVPDLAKEYEKVQLGDPRARLHQERLAQILDGTGQWLAAARKAMEQQVAVPVMPTYPDELLGPRDVQHATALFNGMIHPLIPFALRGAIWYQGESNSSEGRLYTERMKALGGGWREVWHEGDFPFYYVQIAPYNYGGNHPEFIGEFWEAQNMAQSIENTGMAVINDIGNVQDIHPANKQEVGRRLALWALNRTYARRKVVCSGPTWDAFTIEGAALRVKFANTGDGLASRDGKPLSWFEIIDADEGGFVKATARIDGTSVVLTAPGVKHPVAVRYAWHMLAEPNLMNSVGLPAGAFRAGDVPHRDIIAINVPESREYQLLYDLDLAKLGPNIIYDVDNRSRISKPFTRVAYCLELGDASGRVDFVYVSLDAFTQSLDKLGIPTVASGARFQQSITGMNVFSNVKGIVTGTNLAGGNLEFWPNNYGQANAANVPNASAQTYDFGDEPVDPADGYGSMQIHNHDARQTLFALNHWVAGGKADLGIGTQPADNPAKNPDWTFAENAGNYSVKRLRVLVR